MFGAVAVFVILLIALLVLSALRFRERPRSTVPQPGELSHLSPAPGPEASLRAALHRGSHG